MPRHTLPHVYRASPMSLVVSCSSAERLLQVVTIIVKPAHYAICSQLEIIRLPLSDLCVVVKVQ